MTVVGRYIFREFMKMAALCLSGFVGLFLLIDFVEKADDFLEHGASAGEIARYYLSFTPSVFVQIAPVAILVAVLITVALRARTNELTAIFSSGVSLPRVCAPILAGCAIVSLASFSLSETLIPRLGHQAREIVRVRVKPGKLAAQFSMSRYWIRGVNAIVSAQVIDAPRRTLSGFLYLDIAPDFRLVRRIDARTAVYLPDGTWLLRDGRERQASGGFLPLAFDERRFRLPETMQGFLDGETPPSEMTFGQLSDYIGDAQSRGYDVHQYVVDLHAKLAYPLLNVIVSLIAIPFALRTPRSGGVWRSIGAGLVIGFVCWITLSLSLSTGRKGLVPPVVAAWAPDLLFATAGFFLFRRVRG